MATAPKPRRAPRRASPTPRLHLVIVTGLSGSGKGSVLKAFEDAGFYCVDNLPVDLLPQFLELVQQAGEIERAAALVDIRDRSRLEKLPAVVETLRRTHGLHVTLLFLDASDEAILRRFSETRRPHPLAAGGKVQAGIARERRELRKLRESADLVVDTSKFNVHELRGFIRDRVLGSGHAPALQIGVTSFGYRAGVPVDSDLVFDVRFLPNPNYLPQFRLLTGLDPGVARYIRSFPQTREFISRISHLLRYLIPHYIGEGKSYLTIAFGCTGGRHRSVYIAEAVARELRKSKFKATVMHRDISR